VRSGKKMDPELQLITGQLNKLSTDQDKIENSISGIRAGQDGMKDDIQEYNKNDISAVKYSQAEFEEKLTDKSHKQLKCVQPVVERQTQKLREELNAKLKVTWRDI
jgi:hypothetical protein